MLRGSTHYCAIAPWVLSHHIVDFLGSRGMETAPTSIEVILRSYLGPVQLDELADLRGSLSPTTRHRLQAIVYRTWWSQAVTHPIMDPSNYGPGPALLNFNDRANNNELA